MDESLKLRSYELVFLYPPLVDEKAERLIFKRGNITIEVIRPLIKETAFKLFLYGIWAKKEGKKGDVELGPQELESICGGEDFMEEVIRLMGVVYGVSIPKEGEILFHLVSYAEYSGVENRLRLSISTEFYELFEDSQRLYIPFLLELTGKNELALFTFLSTRAWKEEVEDGTEKVQKFRIATLVEKAGINTKDHISKKAWILSKALKNLTELGFLSSFRKENGFFILERPSKEELKIKAIQLKRQRDEKIKCLVMLKKVSPALRVVGLDRPELKPAERREPQ